MWEGAQRLAGWDFKLEMATGKGLQGGRVHHHPTRGSEYRGVKSQAGAYEGGPRVKTWDPLLWRELHRWI